MSRILCIVDGMTDPGFSPERYSALRRMHLDSYADTCLGLPPESLGCILHLLGVTQVPAYLRGYAEALGAGIPAAEGDLIFRGSWFGVDGNGVCTVPVPAPENPGFSGNFRYYPLGQYKSVLIFPGLAGEIEKIRASVPYDCEGKTAWELCPRGNAFLEEVFRKGLETGRCLILWGQSVASRLPAYPQRGAVISGTTVVRGIGRLLDLELIEVPGATGDVDTDLDAKTAAALEAASRLPFVVLHINGADEAGHRKNPAEKYGFLELVNEKVLEPLLASGHEISVTGDHGTDPATGTHQPTLQPLFVWKP